LTPKPARADTPDVPTGAWTITLLLSLQLQPAAPAAPPQPDARPLTHVAQNLSRDLRALPSLASIVIVASGAAGAASVHPADEDVSRWAGGSGRPAYTAVGRTLGDGWVQGTAALATYAIGRLTDRDEIAHTGSDLIRAQILNGVVTTSLKYGIQRTRPSGGRLALPSGHTSASFASAAVLHEHYGWKAGVPAFAAAGFVGWTRVRENVHWLSDVIAGAAIGVLTGRAVTSDHRSRKWAIAPVKTPGGVGVVVTRR
jgi:hypothetical protein